MASKLGSDSQALADYHEQVKGLLEGVDELKTLLDTAGEVELVADVIFTADPANVKNKVTKMLLDKIGPLRQQLYILHKDAYRCLLICEGRITHDDKTPPWAKFM